MTLNVDFYWLSNKEWYYCDDNGFHLKDDAPQEAKDSYNNYLKLKDNPCL